MDRIALTIDGLGVDFEGFKAVNNVSLTIGEGELRVVLGANGAGKTTLMDLISGKTQSTSGRVFIDDTEITNWPEHKIARAGIAYVPQGREIIPDFTIRNNILMGAFARTDGKREIPPLVAELFPYLMQNLDRNGGVLSGGQQQQLAIARALAADPKIILLDEPNEGIQPSIVQEIEAIIVKLNRELGLTVLLVEQNIPFVRRAAQRFAMMEKGRVVEFGDIDRLSDDMVHRHMAV